MNLLVQPLHTRLDMTHFDGREIGHSNTSCARYERCHCEHHMTAKGSRHAFGMAKARVRSVPTGVCMSTPLKTCAALDMMHFHFDAGREVARSSKGCARSWRCRICCEHFLSANESPGRRLGGAKVSMRSDSVRVWVDAPLMTRVTLNVMHFDGRGVGRSAKSFEVPHVSMSTHL